jgi:mitogen-activated protein kinase kinase
MKRKNVKGLALTPAAPKPTPTASNNGQQGAGWGAGGSRHEEGNEAQLEIGIEFNLDLRQEDLEIMKELGSGNGGTVSKIKHLPTGTTMARKVCVLVAL